MWILFMVPSLALMSQSLKEWSDETEQPMHAYAVCSDNKVGRVKDTDLTDVALHDLQIPATTNGARIIEAMNSRTLDEGMTVVFSTYQSIDAVRADGIDVVGPLPADTLFFRARRCDFDCVVAMYHDQGHGPVKVLGLEAGVNITIGLPVVRTSVDHGTAFDIAGTGLADERSMIEALRQAVALATVRAATE